MRQGTETYQVMGEGTRRKHNLMSVNTARVHRTPLVGHFAGNPLRGHSNQNHCH